jgi:ribosome-binding protein aMBF1 (putative translation factor)
VITSSFEALVEGCPTTHSDHKPPVISGCCEGNDTYSLWSPTRIASRFPSMTQVQKRLGQRLRKLRLDRGWTQEQFAERAGKHWTYIGGIERGTRNPTITVLEAIASALGISLADLFTWDEEEERADAPRRTAVARSRRGHP